MFYPIAAQNMSPEQRAFLMALSFGESGRGNPYTKGYGGAQVADTSRHPGIYRTIQSGPNRGRKTSAAGRYQFLESTWDEVARAAGLKDFSPESQDAAAWYYANQAVGGDLLNSLRAGDQETLAQIAATMGQGRRWEALTSQRGQEEFVRNYYQAMYGGAGSDTMVGGGGADALADAAARSRARSPTGNALGDPRDVAFVQAGGRITRPIRPPRGGAMGSPEDVAFVNAGGRIGGAPATTGVQFDAYGRDTGYMPRPTGGASVASAGAGSNAVASPAAKGLGGLADALSSAVEGFGGGGGEAGVGGGGGGMPPIPVGQSEPQLAALTNPGPALQAFIARNYGVPYAFPSRRVGR